MPSKLKIQYGNFTFSEADAWYGDEAPKKKADIVIGDPPFMPYKKAYKQVRKNTKAKLEPITTPEKKEYFDKWELYCAKWKRHMKKTGWLVYKSDSWTAKFTFPITREYFDYSNEVIWDKKRIGLGRRIRTQHENLEVYSYESDSYENLECYTYGPGAYWGQEMLKSYQRQQINLDGGIGKYKIKSWHGSSQGKAFPSILKIPNFNNGTLGKNKLGKRDKHINQTPYQLWIPFLEYMVPEGGLIVDPFMGSGSIAKAVMWMNTKKGKNYRYWGTDIDPKYVKMTNNALFPEGSWLLNNIGRD
jgi:DNA modification methylase